MTDRHQSFRAPTATTFKLIMSAVALRTALLAVVLPSNGCLWLLEKKVAQKRHDEAQAECDKNVAALKQKIDTSLPPARNLDGRWQCFYEPGGESVTQHLTMRANGSQVTITGRDNYGNNIVADGTSAGDRMMYRQANVATVAVSIDPRGRTLNGEILYLAETGCFTTRYVCQR
jgi:hypothetical protein